MSRLQSVAKAFTWRVVADLITFLVGWYVTGNVEVGAGIAGVAAGFKMVCYYMHERVWARVSNE